MPFPESKFELYKAARDGGKTMDECIKEKLVSSSTGYRLERKYTGVTEIPKRAQREKGPDGIRVDGFDAKPKKSSGSKPSTSKKSTPITEHTAGLILKGLSEIGAFLAAENELALDDEEVALLEAPLAESLALLPSELAKGINKYAAPGVFVSQFVAIYARKMQRIALKRAGFARQRDREQPPAQQSTSTVFHDTNLEAVKAAAAAVKMNGEATRVHTASGPAPEESTGIIETEDRKSEFET